VLLPVIEAPAFRDRNHNGRLDPYEDRRLPEAARVADLIGRMTLEEKVGTLLHGTLPAIGNPFGASDKGYDLPSPNAPIPIPARCFARMPSGRTVSISWPWQRRTSITCAPCRQPSNIQKRAPQRAAVHCQTYHHGDRQGFR
jgi:hypothetical protein